MENRIIEDFYNISIIKKQSLLAGYVCKKWILTTQNSKYLLKEMAINELNRLEFINIVQNILSINNLSAKIISTTDGSTYFIYDNHYYVLYEYIDGTHLDKQKLSFQEQYELGYLLGNIHKILNSTKIQNIEKYNTKCLNMSSPNLDRINDLIQLHSRKENKDAICLLKSKLKMLKEFNFEKIEQTYLKYNNKIVHGDFYLDNIIKTNKLLCIDLDQTCVFPLQYEIYRAISMICYDESFDDLKNLHNIENFLKGYKSVYHISDEYLLEGLDLFNYISLNSLYCLGVDDDISYAKYKFKMIEWLIMNKDCIVNIIKGGNNEKTNSNFSYSI